MTTKSETARKTGVVHFTIGDQMGIRLMEISQEHLIYGNDPVKALKTLTDSLIGCPTDFALKILKGDIVLFVDEENQTIMPTERIPEIHDRIFPKVDVVEYIRKNKHSIEKHSMSLSAAWQRLQSKIINNRFKLNVDFDYDDIFKFIAGNDEYVLDTLRDLDDLDEIQTLITASKKFIEHSTNIKNTIEWMSKTWNEFETIDGQRKENPYVDYVEARGSISDSLLDVMQIMQEVLNLEFKFQIEEDTNNVQKYLDSVKEIDEVMSEGIKPVDIMNNYSAGWLSPEGEYYALNGEIANMLHTQIADGLQEIGLIPMYETGEGERYFLKDENRKPNMDKINPDSWLEQQGWVKIHDNNINYGGCLNSHLGKTNVQMTDKQAKIIFEYITKCHGGIMRLGWKMQRVTPTMFLMAFKDKIAMNNKYFEF
jgi:hypothetical protein